MNAKGRIEVNKLRRRLTVHGSVTLADLSRAIEVLEAEMGGKVLKWYVEWGDAPKRSRERIRKQLLETGQPYSGPPTEE